MRSLYDSNRNSSFCGLLIEAFCKNIHFKFPSRPFESIKFHLLRHLAWQCETIGPLWTTSAFLFESANHFLIKPVTGTVKTCKFLVQRYIWNREVSTSELAVDPLNSFIRNLVGTEKRIKDDHGLLKTNCTQELSEQFPSARVFSRYRDAFLLDSKCYARGSANSFVEIEITPNTVGQMLAFYDNGSINC